jgi:hypothetical protein
MQWSKLRALFRERLAPELKQRLDIHMAKYPSGGRGWITYDGIEFAAVQAPGFTRKILDHSLCADLVGGQTIELGSAVFETLNLPIASALTSSNPMIQGLAILEARATKKRLASLNPTDLSSFPATMLAIRQQSMGVPLCSVRCESCGQVLSTKVLAQAHSPP